MLSSDSLSSLGEHGRSLAVARRQEDRSQRLYMHEERRLRTSSWGWNAGRVGLSVLTYLKWSSAAMRQSIVADFISLAQNLPLPLSRALSVSYHSFLSVLAPRKRAREIDREGRSKGCHALDLHVHVPVTVDLHVLVTS